LSAAGPPRLSFDREQRDALDRWPKHPAIAGRCDKGPIDTIRQFKR
jgi:hypothetical protein